MSLAAGSVSISVRFDSVRFRVDVTRMTRILVTRLLRVDSSDSYLVGVTRS